MRLFVRGDIDGFFGLALDNLVNLLLIGSLCKFVLGFDDALLYERVLPGVGASLILGNLFYAIQAMIVASKEKRHDVCALPYGINTPSVFAYVLLVMLPAKLIAEKAGAEDPAYVAWQAGLLATIGSGAIEFFGAFIAERIRRASPRAALLATLSGIALGFISMTFLLRTFTFPVVGFVTLGIVLLTYFGRVKFKGGLPGGLVAVVIGTGIAWASGMAGVGERPEINKEWIQPLWAFEDIRLALESDLLLPYLAIIIPMGLFNLIGSLQNIEAAEAAGDRFATGPSLAVNGAGSLLAASCGSCFPTTIYIGHAGWKAMGARAGYSLINAAAMAALCFSGWLTFVEWAIPIEAAMAIVLWIGIVITAQAFQATPKAHAPAVVLGILPGVAAWGALFLKAGLIAGGVGTAAEPFHAIAATALVTLEGRDVWARGAFALEQGFIFTAVLWASMTVCIIERKFLRGSIWAAIGAALAALGLVHSFQWTQDDTIMKIEESWRVVLPYAIVGVLVWFPWARALERGEGAAKWFAGTVAVALAAIGHFAYIHRDLFDGGFPGRDEIASSLMPTWPWALGYLCVAVLLLIAPVITKDDAAEHA